VTYERWTSEKWAKRSRRTIPGKTAASNTEPARQMIHRCR
jgi:hypothetical protein